MSGSGGHNAYRMTTEECYKLDAAMLRRAGVLDADALKGVYLNFRPGNQSAFIVVVIAGKLSNAMELMIVTDEGRKSRQQIKTSTTPCNYGKHRHWLHCPWCGRRCFTLYYSPNTFLREIQAHLFLCRHCRGLTYEARQKRGADLYETRAIHAKVKLRAWAQAHGVTYEHDLSSWSATPRRPAGMRQSTFAKYEARWEKAAMLAQDEFFRIAATLM